MTITTKILIALGVIAYFALIVLLAPSYLWTGAWMFLKFCDRH
jgi:hypothetical protein